MHKSLILFFTLLLSFSLLSAGDYIIGTDNDTQNKVPLYGYYNYGWSRIMYTADELIASGFTGDQPIQSIAFHVSNTQDNYVTDNQAVYMGYFYDDEYNSTSYANTDYYTQVYSGSVSWNGPGWVEIQLDTPYSFDPSYGWGLEIIWENHDGSGISGPPYFMTTDTSFYSAVYKYYNSSFPTTSGSRKRDYRPNIWLTTETTEPPPPAEALLPEDNATEVELNTHLSWQHTGGSPTEYRLWFGTDNPPTNIVNNLLTEQNSYIPDQYLDYATTYYWKVVPINSFGPTLNAPIWSFSTIADPSIADFPYLETFDGDFPPPGWTHHTGALTEPIVLGGENSSQWEQDDWLNIPSDDQAAKINVWASISGFMISPLFDIPSDDYVLEFDAAVLRYNQPPDGTPPNYANEDDQFAILIGDGYNWSLANIVREYNNSGSEYVLHDIPTTSETISISLAGHTGYKRIAIFAGSVEYDDDNDVMFNNFWIGIPQAGPEAPNVQITLDEISGNPLLSWDAVPDASVYHIYKSNDPSQDYELFDSISGTSCSLDPAEAKAFFKITAE